MRQITVAATQFACSWDLPANADRAEALVRQAAAEGAGLVLIQELFATPYFCITQRPEYFDLAAPMAGHPLIARFADLARQLGVVHRNVRLDDVAVLVRNVVLGPGGGPAHGGGWLVPLHRVQRRRGPYDHVCVGPLWHGRLGVV